MNFLCKIGLHDWKILERESTPQIWEDIKAEESNRIACDILTLGYPFLTKKVCRKCEKLIDEITFYKEKIRPKIKREIELEKKYK